MDTATEAAVAILPAVDDRLSKAEVIAHLREIHGKTVWNGSELTTRSRASRNALIAYHAEVHLRLDNLDEKTVYELRDEFDVKTGGLKKARYALPNGLRQQRVRVATVPHTHSPSIESEQDASILKAAKEGKDLPKMSGGEITRLSKIVDNDFASLRSEIQQFAAERQQEAREAINKDFVKAHKSIDPLVTKARKLAEKANVALDKVKAEAREKGVVLQGSVVFNLIGAKVEAYDRALSENDTYYKEMVGSALATLEQQRLTAQRKILLAGISDEAKALLDTVPEARELMVAAQLKKATKAVEA